MEHYDALADQLMETLDAHCHGMPEPVNSALCGEMAVLRRLEREGESVSAGYLSRELKMTTSRMAAVLNSLEKKGMVERTADASDRRRVMAHLTDKGRRLCQARRLEVREHMTAMLTRLGEEDAAAFVRLIGRVFDAMPEGGMRSARCAAEHQTTEK